MAAPESFARFLFALFQPVLRVGRFIERLWRGVKYEEVYLQEHSTVPELIHGLERWFERYSTWRPHEALGNLTPEDVYRGPSRPLESDLEAQNKAA